MNFLILFLAFLCISELKAANVTEDAVEEESVSKLDEDKSSLNTDSGTEEPEEFEAPKEPEEPEEDDFDDLIYQYELPRGDLNQQNFFQSDPGIPSFQLNQRLPESNMIGQNMPNRGPPSFLGFLPGFSKFQRGQPYQTDNNQMGVPNNHFPTVPLNDFKEIVITPQMKNEILQQNLIEELGASTAALLLNGRSGSNQVCIPISVAWALLTNHNVPPGVLPKLSKSKMRDFLLFKAYSKAGNNVWGTIFDGQTRNPFRI